MDAESLAADLDAMSDLRTLPNVRERWTNATVSDHVRQRSHVECVVKAIPVWLRGALRFSPDMPEPPANPPPPTEGDAEQDARTRARGRRGRRSTILTDRGAPERLSPTGTLGAPSPAPVPSSPSGGGLDGSLRPARGPAGRHYA